MRTPVLVILTTGLVVASPFASRADKSQTVDIESYKPLDLKAYEPPGPNVAVDSTGDHPIDPGKPLDPALLKDPNVVKWPTLDKSVWEKFKNQYKIVPR